MGKMSRNKGATFERLIASILKVIWPSAKRGLQSRGGGKEVEDVIIPEWHVEAMHGVRPNIYKKYDQACHDIKSGGSTKKPLIITRKNNGDILTTLRIDDFVELCKQAKANPSRCGRCGTTLPQRDGTVLPGYPIKNVLRTGINTAGNRLHKRDEE